MERPGEIIIPNDIGINSDKCNINLIVLPISDRAISRLHCKILTS